MKEPLELFFRRKPMMVLIALKRSSKPRYGSQVAKEIDCTYSHAVKILQYLEKFGLVTFEKKGRIKLVKLTQKGNEVANSLIHVSELLSKKTRRNF